MYRRITGILPPYPFFFLLHMLCVVPIALMEATFHIVTGFKLGLGSHYLKM